MNKMSYVRNGQRVVPYCTDCGCRLHISNGGREKATLSHFPGSKWTTDAREHHCDSIAKNWILSKELIYG